MQQCAATAGAQWLSTDQPSQRPPAAHRGGFFVPMHQRSVRLLQRNRLPVLFLQNRGNVGTRKAEWLETLIWQALGAIKSCGNRLGARWEQSGNKQRYRYIIVIILYMKDFNESSIN